MNLSIVIPLLNEAESLPLLVEKIVAVTTSEQYTYEIIFIDDGSSDTSLSVIEELATKNEAIKALSFSRNYGKSAALSVGIEACQGDIIVTMDADLQDDPAAIPAMLALITSENWDVVSGWKKVRHDPVFTKNLPSKLFNFVVSKMSGVTLHDFNCGFKAYRSNAAKSLDIYGERHRFLPAMAYWNGFRVTEMPVTHHARQFGKSKFGMSRFLNGFFDLGTLLFLRKYISNPLHFFGTVGLTLIFLGLAIAAYFGVIFIQTNSLHIRPLLLLAVTSTIVGMQFFSIGLMGEMIAQNRGKRAYLFKKQLKISTDRAL